MFVTKNQFYVFVACIGFGMMCGVLLSFTYFFKHSIKNTFVTWVISFLEWVLISFAFMIYAHYLNFPDLRAYMVISVLLSIVLYFKSFHILLAKFAEKFYNIKVKNILGFRKAKNDRKKIQKINSGNNRRCSNAVDDADNYNGFSANTY